MSVANQNDKRQLTNIENHIDSVFYSVHFHVSLKIRSNFHAGGVNNIGCRVFSSFRVMWLSFSLVSTLEKLSQYELDKDIEDYV